MIHFVNVSFTQFFAYIRHFSICSFNFEDFLHFIFHFLIIGATYTRALNVLWMGFLMAGNRIIKRIKSKRVNVHFHMKVLLSARSKTIFKRLPWIPSSFSCVHKLSFWCAHSDFYTDSLIYLPVKFNSQVKRYRKRNNKRTF